MSTRAGRHHAAQGMTCLARSAHSVAASGPRGSELQRHCHQRPLRRQGAQGLENSVAHIVALRGCHSRQHSHQGGLQGSSCRLRLRFFRRQFHRISISPCFGRPTGTVKFSHGACRRGPHSSWRPWRFSVSEFPEHFASKEF